MTDHQTQFKDRQSFSRRTWRALATELFPFSLGLYCSTSFIVLSFTVRSAIHLELIFVYGVGGRSGFIFFCVGIQLAQHHLMTKTSSTVVQFHLWCKSSIQIGSVCLCVLSSFYVFVPKPHCLHVRCFINKF